MQKFYGFDSTVGVGRNFGFNGIDDVVEMPLEKPVILDLYRTEDMAGVRLEFAQFGDFDSFSVYRSESPINVMALPTPIITGLKTMYASDSTVVEGAGYYYRVAAIRGEDIVISDEVYIVAAFAHKWWRITKIVNRTDSSVTGSDVARSVAEIVFVNKQGIASNVGSKAFANSQLNPTYSPSNAFDGNVNTFANNDYYDTASLGLKWGIGYQFDTLVEVTEIKVQMRQDMGANDGQEWQAADIEYSDNGTTWFRFGSISPAIATMNKALITTQIIT